MKKYAGISVFAMGDFNCNSSSKAYSDLTTYFDDSINTALVYSTKGTATWHNVGDLPASPGSAIDHIFVSKNKVDVLTHEIPLGKNVLDSTDHCPVIIEIKYKDDKLEFND
jgi:endonuclease/exonuclease/phosphatase family metal-dependent hydrolase